MIINLSRDIHAQSFGANNIVHEMEMKQALEIIENLIKVSDYKELENDKYPLKRRHNTITISGDRGSGKTSFLMTLLNNEKLAKDAVILDIIDPTLIEEKGHVFLNILAKIQEKVEPTLKDDLCDSIAKIEWTEQLNSLAYGLPMLDGIDGGLDPSEWNDPTFIMKDGLRRVQGANNFERHFHNLIKLSLEILDKKVFIISFDDVDTDFLKGWPVLETLRKYLTSPQVITILSGDLGLYSMLIRKKQWKNFGKTLLKNEYDKELNIFSDEQYIDLVAKLESQYALKVLKPEYRIMLTTIAAKLQLKQIKIEVQNNETVESKEVYKYYQEALTEKFGIVGAVINDLYIKFFTALPLRSQISILKVLSEEGFAAKKIFEVFYTEIKNFNINAWELTNNYGLTNIHILKFLLDNKILDEGSQLIPKTGNLQVNSTLVAMGAVFTERMYENPFEIFDHIIRVSNIVSKANVWKFRNSRYSESSPCIMDYVEHCRCLYDYGLQKTASLQGAYIVSFGEKKLINEGLIPIKGLIEKDRKEGAILDRRFDEVFRLSSNRGIIDYLGSIPLMGIQDKNGSSKLFYSFFNIIASVGDLLSVENLTSSSEVNNELNRMAQLRYYPVYFNTNSRFEALVEINQESEDEPIDDTKATDITDFTTIFIDWSNKKPEIHIPPYLIGRIMVRTMYSFSNVSITPTTTIAETLHRQIVCFLNAILVEEIMESSGNSKLNLSNPTNSDKNFVANFKNNANSLPLLFQYIISCPLILAYMNTELLNELKIGYTVNIYNELTQIRVSSTNTSISKEERNIGSTISDAKILMTYFIENEISKEEALKDANLSAAIKICFKNTRRPKSDVFNKIKKHLSALEWS